ncbi:hypothetical protein I6I98_13645 [Sphingobacterium multivorum]|uniref:Pectate lyase superfamily protein domain-containing protein n=1 Tax=Sphingobacterium multivorum TaxID=28454 RepID=A0ABX7D0L6_SPHMU|nr:hypothetical protein [Sphingobacterium multivorum]QQT56242.1 hypothetical protein I6I98_13645 [Sphingobacterium multivorum]
MTNQFLTKNTMAEMRGLSACEIMALQSGCCAGVELLGYYEKGDTPAPIVYYYVNPLTDPDPGVDDGGSVIEVQGSKFIHHFQVLYFSYFGALRDGVSDDSLCVKKVLTLIKENKCSKLIIEKGVYKITNQASTEFNNLEGIEILSEEGAHFLNDDFANDLITASATFVDNTATITTVVPHGFVDKLQVVLTDFSDPSYNGLYIITYKDINSFSYTLAATPTANAVGKTRRSNIDNTFLKLSNCKNCKIDLSFKGTIQNVAVQYRLGWVVIKLQDGCSNMSINLNTEGVSYGIYSGEYEKDRGNLTRSSLNVKSNNTGYPIALWKSGDFCTFNVEALDVHRCIYAAAVNNSSIKVVGKNYDVAGVLISIHDVDTTLYGCDNLDIQITDIGTDKTVQLPLVGKTRNTVAIYGYDKSGDVEIKNLNIDIKSVNAKYTTGLFVKTAAASHKVSNLNITGFIDRRKLTDEEIAYECTIGDDPDTVAGSYSNIVFHSWKVYNPVSGTTKPLVLKPRNLEGDIVFNDFHSNSPQIIAIPLHRSVVFPVSKLTAEGNPNGTIEGKLGDVYTNKIATTLDTSVFVKSNNSPNQGWYPMQPVIFGARINRPALSASNRGFSYYDTTIGKPVWWLGSSWLDLSLQNVSNLNTDVTLTQAYDTVIVDGTLANRNVNLPDVTLNRGKIFRIMKGDISINTVSVNPMSGNKIGIQNTIKLHHRGSYLWIISTGYYWEIIGYNNVIYSTSTAALDKIYLNSTYPSTSYPIGTTIFFYNMNVLVTKVADNEWTSQAIDLVS